MKKVFTFVVFTIGLSTLSVSAQTEVKAVIITSSNETLEGTLKDQMQKKGNIVFTSSAGTKKLYAPSDITGFTINAVSIFHTPMIFIKKYLQVAKPVCMSV